MTEYQVKPKDVFVIRGGRRAPPPPPQPGIAGWLKRNRFKLALALIVAELIVAWQFDLSAWPLLIIAVIVLGLFLMYRTRLTNPPLGTRPGFSSSHRPRSRSSRCSSR